MAGRVSESGGDSATKWHPRRQSFSDGMALTKRHVPKRLVCIFNRLVEKKGGTLNIKVASTQQGGVELGNEAEKGGHPFVKSRGKGRVKKRRGGLTRSLT